MIENGENHQDRAADTGASGEEEGRRLRPRVNGNRAAPPFPLRSGQLLLGAHPEEPGVGIRRRLRGRGRDRHQRKKARRVPAPHCRLRGREDRHRAHEEHLAVRQKHRRPLEHRPAPGRSWASASSSRRSTSTASPATARSC